MLGQITHRHQCMLWEVEKWLLQISGPNPRNLCYLVWRRGLCRCDKVKDLEMILSWIIWVSPKCSSTYPCKRETKMIHTQRFEAAGFEDRSDASTSQGMLAATRGWKRLTVDSPLELPEETWPCWHLDFRQVKQVSDFRNYTPWSHHLPTSLFPA